MYEEELSNVVFPVEFEVQEYGVIFGCNFIRILMEFILVLVDNLIITFHINEIDTIHLTQHVHVAIVD